MVKYYSIYGKGVYGNMKDKISSKLSDVYKSLEVAKRYGVDVRMEETTFHHSSISFTKNKDVNVQRLNTIFKDLSELEHAIMDKIKLYQVNSTLSGMSEDFKNSESNDVDDYIKKVKMQLEIYDSCKLPNIYKPENIITEIFGYVYNAIKVEVWFKGKSTLLDDVMKDEASASRISYFLNNDINTLRRIVDSNSEDLKEINNYVSNKEKNDKNEPLIDSELLDMVVNTIGSYSVEDKINLEASNVKAELDDKVNDGNKKREKYIGLAKIQNKTREAVKELKRKIDKKVAPFVLSMVILSGVGLGSYHAVSNIHVDSKETSITEVDSQVLPRTISANVGLGEEKQDSKLHLIVASVATLFASIVPRVGAIPLGVGIYKGKKEYNQNIEKIISRKHAMEQLKQEVESIVLDNKKYYDQINKIKNRMVWASNYSGLTEEQKIILSSIEESLGVSEQLLDFPSETYYEEKTDGTSRRLGC